MCWKLSIWLRIAPSVFQPTLFIFQESQAACKDTYRKTVLMRDVCPFEASPFEASRMTLLM
jgi:hypothetical protein